MIVGSCREAVDIIADLGGSSLLVPGLHFELPEYQLDFEPDLSLLLRALYLAHIIFCQRVFVAH